MATHKKNVIEHRHRKNTGSAEFFRKQRKERNEARGKQDIVVESDGKVQRVRD